MKNKYNQVFIFVVCSLAFMSIPLLMPPGRDGSGMLTAFHIKDIFGYALSLGFFYVAYFILIPRFFFTRQFVWFILFCLAGLLVITVLPNLVHFTGLVKQAVINNNCPPPMMDGGMRPPRMGMDMPPPPGGHMGPDGGFNYMRHITHNVLRFSVVLSVALMLAINNRFKQAQREKQDAEISFLKAQINPHFLFNTLNSIYSLTITKSDDAPEAVVKLSGMMRYSISDAVGDYVSLDKELDYIQNYIDLQKIRLTARNKVTYNLQGSAAGKTISPFLLIPFVENAFTHGINPEADTHIDIQVTITGTVLQMNIANDKVYTQKDTYQHTGIGIDNTRKRLAMLYPGKHMLAIQDTDDAFHVSLNIDLA